MRQGAENKKKVEKKMPKFHEIQYFYIDLSDLLLLASGVKHSGHGGKV